ncbi:MAG TPA: hypothetical protein VIV57_24680 [Anaeromyxobacter sp.]
MKKSWPLVALVLALASLLAAAPAAASTVSECQNALRTLATRTDDALFAGGQGANAQQRLLSHLTKASSAFDKLDFKDVLKQLDAYSADLSRAAASGKLKAADAVDLQISANAVTVCVTAIGR